MKYYKVKNECDNKSIYSKKGNYLVFDGILIGGELLTPTEYKKIMDKSVNIRESFFDVVEVNKNNIFWSFGARFS